MSQLVLMMCKTNLHDSNYCDNVFNSPEAGSRDNIDRQWQCMPRPRNRLHVGQMSGPESLTCPRYCQYRRYVCLVSIMCCAQLKRVTCHAIEHISLRKSAMNLHLLGCFFCPALFLISIQIVYLKNANSHITDFSPCSIMSLESVAHLINHFIPKLEVKQTPDKAVAPSQPIL